MLFDAHLHADAIPEGDFEDLAWFGVSGALAATDDSPSAASVAAIREHWDRVSRGALRRMKRAGLSAFAAVGIHPRRIPWRGLESLLAELPDVLSRPGVVAIGEVGLDIGSQREEEVLASQLELARELRLPVLLHTPERAKTRITRQLLGLLNESELDPARILVDHADGRTVKMIRACGFHAGLTLSAGRRDGVDEAVKWVASLGPEGLVFDSDAGDGASDLLALPRAADRLRRGGLSEAVVRRVCGENAIGWLGIDPAAARGRPPPPRTGGASGRSGRPSSP
jgi:predicted metal-dependent TIM-barrel fold hydrolase